MSTAYNIYDITHGGQNRETNNHRFNIFFFFSRKCSKIYLEKKIRSAFSEYFIRAVQYSSVQRTVQTLFSSIVIVFISCALPAHVKE